MMLYTVAMLVLYGQTNPAAFGWLLSLASFVGNFVYWFPEKGQSIAHTGHLWSLSYEFQIYLALPFLFLASVASGKRAFVIALLAAVPLCLAARASFALSGMSWQMSYLTPLLRPESTIVGVLIALGMTQKIPLWVMLTVFIASVAGLLFLPDIYSRYGQVTVYLNSAIFAGALLHLALHAPLLATVLRFAPIAYLGRISFGLYIFHACSGQLGADLLSYMSIRITFLTGGLAALAVSAILAIVSYHLFEKPITRWKPRYRTAPTPAFVPANA